MSYANPTQNVPVQLQQGGTVLAIGSGGTLGVDNGALVDFSGLPAVAERESSADTLTALAGGGQAGATLASASINRFTTVATANDSAILPASVSGTGLTIINAAANSMNVFPAVGEKINALATNAAFAIAGGKTCNFYCCSAGQWHTITSS